jgi:AAA domain-containing protein
MSSSSPSELPPLALVWSGDLRQAGSALNWLWHGYLAPGNVTLLTSQWKAGKTTLVAALLGCLGRGGELAGLPVRPGKAVVVSEESPSHWSLRSQRFGLADQVCFVCRPFRGKPTLEEWLGLLDRLVELHGQFGLDLVVFDPLASFLPSGCENQADAMLEALLPLQRLTRRGLAILLLHHPRKERSAGGMAARGSGALTGFADVVAEMHWQGDPAGPDRRRLLLAWSRHDETPRRLLIELNEAGTGYRRLADEEAAELSVQSTLWRVLREARTRLTRWHILELWPPDQPKPARVPLWRLLSAAVERGELRQEGSGTRAEPFRYWLAPEERRQQDPSAEQS